MDWLFKNVTTLVLQVEVLQHCLRLLSTHYTRMCLALLAISCPWCFSATVIRKCWTCQHTKPGVQNHVQKEKFPRTTFQLNVMWPKKIRKNKLACDRLPPHSTHSAFNSAFTASDYHSKLWSYFPIKHAFELLGAGLSATSLGHSPLVENSCTEVWRWTC